MIKLKYIRDSEEETLNFDEKNAFLDIELSKKSIRISILTNNRDIAHELMSIGKKPEPDNIIIYKNDNKVFELAEYKKNPNVIKYNDRMRIPYGYFTEIRIVVDLATEKVIEEGA